VNATERLRRRHKPGRITLLFIGESAPAGGTFFYAENSTLYFEMRLVFEASLKSVFQGSPQFLETFKALGCYLDDVCLEPVNHLAESDRKSRRLVAEAALAGRLEKHSPLAVVAIGKTTAAPHVQRAMAQANLEGVSFDAVSFPGRPEHKEAFKAALRAVIRRARRTGVLSV